MRSIPPDRPVDVRDLESRLIDLHPVIRDYVYHPDFQGSFSLKFVLPAFVPELTYDDLVIVDGMVASVEIRDWDSTCEVGTTSQLIHRSGSARAPR